MSTINVQNLSVDYGILILIQINEGNIDSIKTLVKIFHVSYFNDWINELNSLKTLEVKYNIRFNNRQKKELRRAVRSRGGEVKEITELNKPPLFTEKTKRMMRDAAIISTLTFVTTLGGNKAITDLDLEYIMGISFIPAVTAFISKIMIDLKINPPNS
jgi:hypothetical protein